MTATRLVLTAVTVLAVAVAGCQGESTPRFDDLGLGENTLSVFGPDQDSIDDAVAAEHGTVVSRQSIGDGRAYALVVFDVDDREQLLRVRGRLEELDPRLSIEVAQAGTTGGT